MKRTSGAMKTSATNTKGAADARWLARPDLRDQGRFLLRSSIVLVLLVSAEGIAIPSLPAPRLGVTAHTLGYMLGTLSLALGLIWPRLDLGRRASRIALWAYLYSAVALVAAYTAAAAFRAGASVMPLAAAGARGTPVQEVFIGALLASASATFVVSMAYVLWGLRKHERAEDVDQRG
jgi:hydroxylaminobenzene mutase